VVRDLQRQASGDRSRRRHHHVEPADGSRPNTHTIERATIAPGQYFTLGSAASGTVPAYIDYGYGTDLGNLSNTAGGKLALSCGDAEIDSALYGDVVQGHSRELTAAVPPDYTLNDDQASWCQPTARSSRPATSARRRGERLPADHRRPVQRRRQMRSAVAPGPATW